MNKFKYNLHRAGQICQVIGSAMAIITCCFILILAYPTGLSKYTLPFLYLLGSLFVNVALIILAFRITGYYITDESGGIAREIIKPSKNKIGISIAVMALNAASLLFTLEFWNYYGSLMWIIGFALADSLLFIFFFIFYLFPFFVAPVAIVTLIIISLFLKHPI